MRNRNYAIVLAFLCAFTSIDWAAAAVVITGTRVIYPEQQREVSVKLNNNGRAPSLVQAWVDAGDATTTPTTSTAPFLLAPPVFRIDPGKGQTMRLSFTGAALPTDRETVFYLNVLEIPPKAESNGANRLDMAFRSRIKLFYRPRDLKGQPSDAPKSVTWSLKRSPGGYALEGTNPTAFHVSQTDMFLISGSQRYRVQNGMLAPGERKDFRVEALKDAQSSVSHVEFKAINDYGALVLISSQLENK
ncbi:fimbria/pilus periplasmic chaperone [Stenotrophomonas sp. HMWF003]|uniref:fimbrial biogenesis chaperone n=1 Tax=Stenotrophomonas sp. HMWF003 TaxID=2056840 RepID=UPI000D46E8D5|nr:fimbria/pilus periplasmic chaperone [Stenotrophomonas sp. HMWF003]PTT64671.1 molecular chaperone EcpD [Stenotrophomonas sp. HMWF003]